MTATDFMRGLKDNVKDTIPTTDDVLGAVGLQYQRSAAAASFNTLAALHGDPHRIEDGVDSYLGLNLRDVGHLRDFVDDVNLDQGLESPDFV